MCVCQSNAEGHVVETGHADAGKKLQRQLRSRTRNRHCRVFGLRPVPVHCSQHGVRTTKRRCWLRAYCQMYVLYLLT